MSDKRQLDKIPNIKSFSRTEGDYTQLDAQTEDFFASQCNTELQGQTEIRNYNGVGD